MSNLILKFCVLGGAGVGKTTLIETFINEKPQRIHRKTYGLDFSQKTLSFTEDLVCQISIWDCAYFKAARIGTMQTICEEAAVCFLVVDASNYDASVQQLRALPLEYASKCIKILIINKIDVPKPKSQEDYIKLTQELGCVAYMPASAETDAKGVQAVFKAGVHAVMMRQIGPAIELAEARRLREEQLAAKKEREQQEKLQIERVLTLEREAIEKADIAVTADAIFGETAEYSERMSTSIKALCGSLLPGSAPRNHGLCGQPASSRGFS